MSSVHKNSKGKDVVRTVNGPQKPCIVGLQNTDIKVELIKLYTKI